MDAITYHPIGVVHSPFDRAADVPVDPDEPSDAAGRIDIDEEYAEGLLGLDGFSHVTVLAHLHESHGYSLTVRPSFADGLEVGIFATSGPHRPNPIAQTIVRLQRIEDATLYVEGVDLADGTPVLDLKPFAPKPGALDDLRGGWFEEYLDQEF